MKTLNLLRILAELPDVLEASEQSRQRPCAHYKLTGEKVARLRLEGVL